MAVLRHTSAYDAAEGRQYLVCLRYFAEMALSVCITPDKSGFNGRDYMGGSVFLFEPKKSAWLAPVVPLLIHHIEFDLVSSSDVR